MTATTRYSGFPDHPLRDVPQEVLDAARKELDGAVIWKDVDAEMAHPLADAVVIALLPWLRWDEQNGRSTPSNADDIRPHTPMQDGRSKP